MHQLGPYLFKIADTDAEFEQIHRLNFQTFVREIPQHADRGGDTLVDKFHHKNTYIVAVRAGRVVGMLCAHRTPPFSVADRLADPAVLTKTGVNVMEVRLLAVQPGERHGAVVLGMVFHLNEYGLKQGVTHFVISGVSEQRELYEHIGFEPIGDPVGSGRATFTPMWVPLERIQNKMSRTIEMWSKRLARETPMAVPDHELVCLLPGPVAIAPEVHQAFHQPLIYHRGDAFLPLYEKARERLSQLVGGKKKVAMFVGSGTMANDAVAATLAADEQRHNGLVLVNGEFGDRLRKQAARMGLNARVLSWDWGRPWSLNQIEAAFREMPRGGWVWGVHHETSTGVLNDLPAIVKLANECGHRVCVDCVSSLATVPVDLSGVYLASGASGKAIGSYAGLAFVFADPADLAHIDPDTIPTYLDVPSTLSVVGPRFTVPSPLLLALGAALEPLSTPELLSERLRAVCELGRYLRGRLRELGLTPMAADAHANPSIVTFAPPPGETAAAFVDRCRGYGFQIAGQSGYLAERNLVQIAVMGHVTSDQIDQLLAKLAA